VVENCDVLIVDDDLDLASNLRDVLGTAGYCTVLAADGQKAVNLCHQKVFDLGLIDIMLPDMPGVKLVERLAEISPAMEYIIITGYASFETAVEAVKHKNIVAYETKPLNFSRFLALVRQVTERKRMERKIVEYEGLNKLKTNILSMVSHELRTPLATIKGYSTMLLDYDDRLGHDEKLTHLVSIDRATDRLTELVEHLLDMSRLDAGLLKINKQPTSIAKLLRQAVTMGRARAPQYSITCTVEKKLPRVNVDARRIRQVLDNLIDNAVKYSEEGGNIVLEAQCVGEELRVSVSDEGVGVPVEERDRVFDRMYHLEERLSQGGGGLGLGLAVCKGLVEAHGGRIWIEDNDGKGSKFVFTSPL